MRIVLTPRIPPPSMHNTRTPRFETERLPVARRTSSFSPKIAKARVAARITSGSTTVEFGASVEFGDASGGCRCVFFAGDAIGDALESSGAAPYTTRPPATDGSPPPLPSAYEASMFRAYRETNRLFVASKERFPNASSPAACTAGSKDSRTTRISRSSSVSLNTSRAMASDANARFDKMLSPQI